MAKITIVAAVLVAASVGLLALSVMRQARVSCEVCVSFRGHSQCRTARGPNRQEAIRTATDNACAFLASGMTDSIACSNTPPTLATCDGG